MPHVIIGHTSSDSVRIWVKGDASGTTCELTLQPPPASQPLPISLYPDSDYTAAREVPGLEADVEYAVLATFRPSGARVRGRVRTFKAPAAGAAVPFSFVLSSCNLSIVSINDFLARLSATAGAAFANSSLEIAPYRWRWPKSPALQSVVRAVGGRALQGVAAVIQSATGLKQTGSTYLRSPFLKLSAIFESSVVDLPLPRKPEAFDETYAFDPEGPRRYAADLEEYSREKRRLFLAAGDHVESSDGATGIVASVSDDDDRGLRRLVITCVDGIFTEPALLFRCVTDRGKTVRRPVTLITGARPGRVWYEPPSFFIHAGDQIYYDFPDPARAPDQKAYRLAYREAWFEDDALRRLLAEWPHYMTLDDHEIADQYARDFNPPHAGASPDRYLEQAEGAYREYVDALNPRQDRNKAGEQDRLWFTFEKGAARFFVLDTRTQRSNKLGRIIGDDQMQALLDWLSEQPNALKFVVTSVPFVAEIKVAAADDKQDWYDPKRNSEQDKWSAPEFKAQRDQVIAHIHRHKIENLVFLAGDMHCCYHATMRIGKGATRYQATVVHELAGGPVNQLQLGRVTDFACHRKACAGELEYEVRLERFHGDVSAVMHLKVDYAAREPFHKGAVDAIVPEVEWNVIRTLTDPGPQGWFTEPARGDGAGASANTGAGEAVMGGRISFARRREPEELMSWR